MKEPGLIFHVIAEAGDQVNTVKSFMKHLVDIFAHVKTDIIEFCESISMSTLLAIRTELFKELQNIFPHDDYELSERRKLTIIADDVYTLGFSLVNKCQHKNLNKIVRKVASKSHKTSENTCQTDVETEYIELLTLCTSLKETVKDLTFKLREATNRLTSLEGDITILKTKIQDDDEIQSKQANHLPEVRRSIIVKADVHADKYGVKQPVSVDNNKKDLTDLDVIEELDSSDEVDDNQSSFRHTSKERKNILKRAKRRPTQKMKVATGGPAEHGKPESTQSYLVYVGNLSKDTSEANIRSHLNDIGILKVDVADIIKLKSRNTLESSYCISLHSAEANKLALAVNQWPVGVRVRKYYRELKGQVRRYNYSDKSPRFYSSYEKHHLMAGTRTRRGNNSVSNFYPNYPTLDQFLPFKWERSSGSHQPRSSYEYNHQSRRTPMRGYLTGHQYRYY